MGLKAEDRDLLLPKHRKALRQAIEEDSLNDEQILGVFYGGSIGTGNTDLYSDIDLRIVVKDEAFEAYRANKRERAKKWGQVLFFEDASWTAYSVAHYSTFIKVDTFYYKVRDIQPSIWLKEIQIVKDRDGFLEKIMEESAGLSYSPSVQEVKKWSTKFYAHTHEVYRRVRRNELYYALHSIDSLRLSIVAGWYMETGIQPNTFGDWSKLEGSRSKLLESQLNLLAEWHSDRKPEDICSVLEKIIPEFKKIHKNLCSKLEIDENRERVDQILNKVLQEPYQ